MLGAELGRGWYGVNVPGEWYWNMANYHGEPRLLARLVIDYADGTSQTIVTDHATWKATDGPTTFDSVYTGEKYDARIAAALGDWQKAGYDDSAWTAGDADEPARVAARRAPAPASCPTPARCRPGSSPAKLRAQENQPVHVYEELQPGRRHRDRARARTCGSSTWATTAASSPRAGRGST